MKFYKYKHSFYYWNKIINDKLTAIYCNDSIWFLKNGKEHNYKNAAFIYDKYKQFYLNGNFYGDLNNFTKKSWRRFVKMQVFL
jgi:hypothetical protein